MHDAQNYKQGMFKLFNKLYNSSKKITIAIALNLSIIYLFVVPKCRSNAGLRTFHAIATCLRNCLDHNVMNMTKEMNFTKHIFLKINLSREHFVFVTRFFKALFWQNF